MITGISIENFKGIGDSIEIPFKPITLLFGPNSAGKSSIVHALHYAREIFERGNLNPDLTVSGGNFADLGGFRGLVHQHDSNRSVKLGIDIDLEARPLPLFENSPPYDVEHDESLPSWDKRETRKSRDKSISDIVQLRSAREYSPVAVLHLLVLPETPCAVIRSEDYPTASLAEGPQFNSWRLDLIGEELRDRRNPATRSNLRHSTHSDG